jgi:DNA (cytosine-5)-methyltransferase 1
MNELRELSLFSGYGGFSLGLKLTGIPTRTVMYVEWEKYPQEIIKARINDKILDDAPIWGDISTLNGEQFRGVVDLITGGFPCQPHSHAGLRKGADDERNLWPETLRIIREVRPRYVLLENVSGILSASRKRGTPAYGGVVVGELAQEGYRLRWETVGADDVGAPHRRKRWLCFGELENPDRGRFEQRQPEAEPQTWLGQHGERNDGELADSSYEGLEGGIGNNGDEERTLCSSVEHDREAVRSRAGRSIDQLANSIDSGNTPRRLHGEPGRERKTQTQEGEDNPLIGSGRQERTGNDELADSDSNGTEWNQSADRERSGLEQGRQELGNSDSYATQGMEQGSQQSGNQRPVGLPDGTSQLPVWPPSPSDTDGWEQALRERPDLAPAITKEAESEFRGVANGRSGRVDRLKALGNGLVPSVVAEFLRRVTTRE